MSSDLEITGGSALSQGFVQLQRQQALRQARQLEVQAEALASQASRARQEADAADRRADELETRAGGVRSAARSAGLRNASAEGFDRLVQRINNGAATPVQPAAAPAAGGVTYTSTAGTSPVLQAVAGQIINELA